MRIPRYILAKLEAGGFQTIPRVDTALSSAAAPDLTGLQMSPFMQINPQHSQFNMQTPIDMMGALNPLIRGISEAHARGQQQDYMQQNTANPLSNLAFDDGRSKDVKYGYQQFGDGGDVNKKWLKDWYSKRIIPDKYFQEALELDKKDLIHNIDKSSVNYVDQIDKNTPQINGRTVGQNVYLSNNTPDYTQLHELDHAANNFPSYTRSTNKEVIADNIKSKDDVKGVYKDKYDYFSNPDEIHSRLQVLRQQAGFKPDKKVSPEELHNFLYNKYKGNIDNINDLGNMTDENQLLQLLNYTTSVNNNKQLNKAKEGGEVQWEMKKGGIHIKESKKGSLHSALGVPEGEKIPASKLSIKDSDSPALKKKKQFAINAKKFKHEDGGIIEEFGTGGEKKVDKVPEGFNPLRTEGNRQYYNKLSAAEALQQAAGTGQGGAQYDNFLQQKASQYPIEELIKKGYGTSEGLAKYRGLYKPSEEIVYTEQNPSSSPAVARRGEPIYDGNKHISAELFYPSRDSQNQSSAGVLNTSQQSPHIKFRNDFGYTGEEADLSADEVQKFLGTTNTFQSPEMMTTLKNRSKLTKFAQGGSAYRNKILSYLYDNNDEEDTPKSAVSQNTAPTVDEIDQASPEPQMQDNSQEELLNSIMSQQYEEPVNPYKQARENFSSSGKYGTKNISPVGEQIASDISQGLGHTPVFNSIYRDPAQNRIVGGKPNSYHLTGSAVDLKPSDWRKLPKTEQEKIMNLYKVINEGNHFHIQPNKR